MHCSKCFSMSSVKVKSSSGTSLSLSFCHQQQHNQSSTLRPYQCDTLWLHCNVQEQSRTSSTRPWQLNKFSAINICHYNLWCSHAVSHPGARLHRAMHQRTWRSRITLIDFSILYFTGCPLWPVFCLAGLTRGLGSSRCGTWDMMVQVGPRTTLRWAKWQKKLSMIYISTRRKQ